MITNPRTAQSGFRVRVRNGVILGEGKYRNGPNGANGRLRQLNYGIMLIKLTRTLT